MQKFYRLLWLTLASFVFAGCQTPSSPPPAAARPSPPRSPPPAPMTVVTVPEPMAIAPPQPILPEPIITEEPTIAAPWPTNWVQNWVPLESWCQFNGFAPPVRIKSNPRLTCAIRTTNGLMEVHLERHTLRFDGVECWLGFAPQMIQGQPVVYALDAQKTLQPLANLGRSFGPAGRTLVLDPGHGGKDPGARNVFSHQYEKIYTLDWALRLQHLLVTNGWNVWLTRSKDTDVSLSERVAIAEQVNADLFLSLHFNSGSNAQTREGLETYCLTPTGLPSNLLRSGEDDPRQQYPNNAFDEQNMQWAFRLQRALLAATGAVDHGVRRARMMAVLRGQKRPAVLIEGGYLSNLLEARKIATAEYRQILAEAVAEALEGGAK